MKIFLIYYQFARINHLFIFRNIAELFKFSLIQQFIVDIDIEISKAFGV
jgi:hypothetical protein